MDLITLEDEVHECRSRRYQESGVRFEIGNLGDQRCRDVFENELGDAVPDVDFEFVLAEIEDTGGEPLFTHWVHGEYMVGSETKYPAWTHRVHFDYILIIFTICPPKYPPGTC